MLAVPVAPRRLLAAHVDPDGNPGRRRLVEETWGGIERRSTPAWTLSCLIAAGGPKYALAAGAECEHVTLPYGPDPPSALTLELLRWLAASRAGTFDFVLKLALETLPCFNMLTDLLDASRPGVALGHADRLLRLRTLYMSDDARDLVAIVGERYKEDIARFGYVFPENSSAPTMRT